MEKNYYVITNTAKKRFKVWLVQNGITLRQFANKCNVSAAYISKVINGKSHITPKCLEIFQRGGYKLL